MKPPVVLFKRKILKLYLLLTLINPVVCCLHKRKDAKKNVKKKIGEIFRINLFYFLYEFQE